MRINVFVANLAAYIRRPPKNLSDGLLLRRIALLKMKLLVQTLVNSLRRFFHSSVASIFFRFSLTRPELLPFVSSQNGVYTINVTKIEARNRTFVELVPITVDSDFQGTKVGVDVAFKSGVSAANRFSSHPPSTNTLIERTVPSCCNYGNIRIILASFPECQGKLFVPF